MNDDGAGVSVLVCAYNEEGTIAVALAAVRRVLPAAEILAVDDGSTDDTAAQVRRCGVSGVRLVRTPHRGKGHAIRMGASLAQGTLMVQIDADLQFPAEGIATLLAPLRAGAAQVVCGSRYLQRGLVEPGAVTFFKRAASYAMAACISALCGRRFTDVFAGFKAWDSAAFRGLGIREDGFCYEAEIVYAAVRKGLSVIEVPTRYRRRERGASKIKFLVHAVTIPWNLARVVCARR